MKRGLKVVCEPVYSENAVLAFVLDCVNVPLQIPVRMAVLVRTWKAHTGVCVATEQPVRGVTSRLAHVIRWTVETAQNAS